MDYFFIYMSQIELLTMTLKENSKLFLQISTLGILQVIQKGLDGYTSRVNFVKIFVSKCCLPLADHHC